MGGSYNRFMADSIAAQAEYTSLSFHITNPGFSPGKPCSSPYYPEPDISGYAEYDPSLLLTRKNPSDVSGGVTLTDDPPVTSHTALIRREYGSKHITCTWDDASLADELAVLRIAFPDISALAGELIIDPSANNLKLDLSLARGLDEAMCVPHQDGEQWYRPPVEIIPLDLSYKEDTGAGVYTPLGREAVDAHNRFCAERHDGVVIRPIQNRDAFDLTPEDFGGRQAIVVIDHYGAMFYATGDNNPLGGKREAAKKLISAYAGMVEEGGAIIIDYQSGSVFTGDGELADFAREIGLHPEIVHTHTGSDVVFRKIH